MNTNADEYGGIGSSSSGTNFPSWPYSYLESMHRNRSRRNRLIVGSIAIFLLLVFSFSHRSDVHADVGTDNGISSVGGRTNAGEKNNEISNNNSNNNMEHAANDNLNHQHEQHSTSTSTSTSNNNQISTTVSSATPKIIYLLTYPMSGSTFTMELIEKATQVAVATNSDAFNPYHDSNDTSSISGSGSGSGSGSSINNNNGDTKLQLRPISVDYPNLLKQQNNVNDNTENTTASQSTIGYPFWTKSYEHGILPANNVLTLSHCSGYCMAPCSPIHYVMPLSSFEESCRQISSDANNSNNAKTESYIDNDNDNERQSTTNVLYTPQEDMGGIIHLIRDPLSNVVSRFHEFLTMNPHWLQEQQQQNRNPQQPNTNTIGSARSPQENFKTWCREMDSSDSTNTSDPTNSFAEEQSSPLFSTELKRRMKSIPCHSEFIKYVSWHNHVVEMSWGGNVPKVEVFFEDYADVEKKRLDVKNMAEFLGYEVKDGNLPLFLGGKLYRDGFYSDEEVKALMGFVKYMSLGQTWELLKRYFDE